MIQIVVAQSSRVLHYVPHSNFGVRAELIRLTPDATAAKAC